jgi:hypothetical protein
MSGEWPLFLYVYRFGEKKTVATKGWGRVVLNGGSPTAGLYFSPVPNTGREMKPNLNDKQCMMPSMAKFNECALQWGTPNKVRE